MPLLLANQIAEISHVVVQKGSYSLIFKEWRARGVGVIREGGITEDLRYLYMGCLPFVQTTWVEILCLNIKTIKFDVEGEQLATKYIEISWTD